MIGVNPYVTHSPALKITAANSGLIPAFINTGTVTPLKIDHLLTLFGKTNVHKALIRNNNIIKGIPVNPELLITFDSAAVITCPILVFLKIKINVEAKNINTKILPILSKE
jgi:hypothetical protein